MNNTAQHQLSIERSLKAPLSKIWRCWTEPELLKQWFCPKPWYVSTAVIELKSGGEFSTTMNGPNGEVFKNLGIFLEVIPEKKLVFTDAIEPHWIPAEKTFMLVEIHFSPAPDNTTFYQVYAKHWSEQACKEHEAMGFDAGWNIAADQLEVLAQSL